jgi:hypothetical protein
MDEFLVAWTNCPEIDIMVSGIPSSSGSRVGGIVPAYVVDAEIHIFIINDLETCTVAFPMSII